MAPLFTKRKRQYTPPSDNGSTIQFKRHHPSLSTQLSLQPPTVSTITTTQPKIWTTLTSPIFTTPNSSLKLTWHLHNPHNQSAWSQPIILSMLICKSSPASAMLGAWTDGQISGDQVLLRTKFDMDAHEERYEYLTETVCEPVVAGESVDVVAEIGVPDGLCGRYWGCFKILREGEREFYCSFSIIARDERLLEYKVGEGIEKERKMLEKMLLEQPSPPLALTDMCLEPLKDVSVSSYEDPSFESPMDIKVKLPSLFPWCRQCDQNGHIDYASIPCGRCGKNHQTSECPITIMGMCVYCCAVGKHFSQLCSLRKRLQFCHKCGKTDHEDEHCTDPRDVTKIECYICKETGHFARRCPKEQCPNCKEYGHQFKDCYAEPKCDGCGESGHSFRDCQQRGCETCGESTHRRYECRARYPLESLRCCERCKEPGHFTKDCPKGGTCSVCHLKGHRRSECPKVLQYCELCGSTGFHKWSCASLISCEICFSKAHLTASCASAAAAATAAVEITPVEA